MKVKGGHVIKPLFRLDNIPPVVSCINDITQEIPLNSFGFVVEFTEPTATDNSGTASVLSATRRPGQFFQTGTTTVTYIFADPSGNTADCVFDIIVVEVNDTPPDVTCIQDITRIVTIDSTGTTVSWTEPTATDNSGVVSLQSRSHAPGDFFSPGTTQVTYIFVDPSGQTANCIFTVTVTPEDNVPPVVSCIPDVTETTPLGTGGRTVLFTEPTATNDSGAVSLQQRTHGPGTFFSSGVTQVTYIFVDPAGNTAECTFRVIVTEIDGVPPVIACVGLDVTETIPLNGFGTTVQFREPTATDNSGTANFQSRTHTPGQFFQSGTTEVTYVFIDPSGNTAQCSFNIIITEVDNIPPVVSCISDITREIPLNSFGVVVDFTEPTATDNSGTASVLSATRRPGQFFQTGTTTVTYIFADPSGNTADCVFDIIVVEVNDTPPDVTCIQDITRIVTIDSTGTTVSWTEPTATDNSGVVSLQSRSHAPGDFFSPGTTQVTYIFVDPSGQTANCIFTVTVTPEDNVPPVVSCIPDVTETTPLGTGGRTVLFTEPTATNDSGAVSLQQRTHGPGTFFSSGVTQVTYIFVDPAGNTAECTFRVIVTEIDGVPPVIACVGLDVTETIPLNGFGTTVQFREPTATDNSGTANFQSRTHTSGQFFQSGTTEVTYVFIDPSGNTAQCSFNIIITEVFQKRTSDLNIGLYNVSFSSVDNIPPVVSCISGITREIPLISFGVVVDFTEPTATDNSGTASVLSATRRPGQFFQTGTTTVTYIFADPSGNTADCVFDIIVVEVNDTPPDVTCIQDITRIVTIDSTGTTVSWTEPTATDNSGVVSLQSRSHAPGDFFSPGTTQVTYIFVDPSGQTANCIFTVTVTPEDNVPPVVSCIPDVTETTPLGTGGRTVLFTEPTATNDSGAVSLQQRTHGPGTFFSSGVTQVTYIFVDPAGNTAECTFRVIVTEIDGVPPVIACVGLDVTETIPLNGFCTTVQFREPTATDNSGTANFQSRTHTSGQFFQSGTTEVTYVFIDPSGNTAQCSFNIIITEGLFETAVSHCCLFL
ncbi:hyalin-like [Apostichopus japonicus]|uniref:hyalin-like n=1 Tax=Stichopus japonicus TaxID=307972 RepID=UPI003AB8DDC7